MKKFFSVVLVLLFSLALFGCDDYAYPGEKIILITDKGDITDKSFNQGSFEGVKAYATKNNIKYGYFKPEDATDEMYISAIEQAIADGATIIVTPGFLFEPAINELQGEYPEVKFILLDGSPGEIIESNVYSVFYAEEQSGFLAGYAAVKDGYRKLGFMGGMAVPAVQRFGHGFVQGAAVAAAELELENNAIDIKYLYTGDFKATPEVQAAASNNV